MDQQNHTDKKFLTTVDCAELIGRTPGAVRNLVMRRMIPYRKPAGRLVFLTTEIEQWIYQAPGLTLKEYSDKERN